MDGPPENSEHPRRLFDVHRTEGDLHQLECRGIEQSG